ncbi:hypothetical protein LWC34_36385 [Kibdelosporangium philippinense]|uniref:Uncharacterized protein n=1 Tax=Kibdelosporangium philippinense TaxID=211113 RepID=A0ABS8ZKJ4_9PSEU|nr:contact-dependent growth inhibition system immunity protein [Kibdelosporangium philippinense]MCE7008255.1 hypothetical protein [Kibdelosporangium philippinense]
MDKKLSLEQIENNAWGEAPADATGLMRTVYNLRGKPIGELEPGDIRTLLSQQEGIKILLPAALDLLESEPLMDASYYAGDLLAAVLRLPQSHWTANPTNRTRIEEIIKRAKHMLDLDEDLSTPNKAIEEAVENFT